MKINKTICLDEDIVNALKGEENSSELITNLLREHYKTNITDTKVIDEKLNSIEERRNKLLKDMEIEEKGLTEVKVKRQEIELTEQSLMEKELERKRKRIENCIINTKDIFGVELTEEQAKEYLNGEYGDIKEFLEKKALWHEVNEIL